ncbi:dihydrofolate reductase [Paraburkholderia tropica]|uniref:dihydrofolate reductase n=1 Tax=Paraburkholderia tropica TaxID=92647 RepID=UPI00094297C6|nr:dihydrofolate reductase [Paraburkholderia tropica]RQN37256.1 dihydrofolate reductase [Paraburkholderia tropica]
MTDPLELIAKSIKPIKLIVAMDENRVIGDANDIPWRIKGEQRRFKELTIGKSVIMGRKTFESIPNGLPGRNVIVLTRSKLHSSFDATQVSNPIDALRIADKMTDDAIFIGGGEEIYRIFLPFAKVIYLTKIHASFGGSRHFPSFDESLFEIIESETISGNTPFTYLTYVRK